MEVEEWVEAWAEVTVQEEWVEVKEAWEWAIPAEAEATEGCLVRTDILETIEVETTTDTHKDTTNAATTTKSQDATATTTITMELGFKDVLITPGDIVTIIMFTDW